MCFIALEGKDLIIINKQTQSFSCPSKPPPAFSLTPYYISSIAILYYQNSLITLAA